MKPATFQRARRAKRTPDINGRMHASAEEAAWYDTLIRLERCGIIRDLEPEPSWRIEHQGEWVCSVKADARYFDTRDGRVHVVDHKGRMGDTPVSALKRRMALIWHGVEIELQGAWVERKRREKAKRAFERDLAQRPVNPCGARSPKR